MLDAEAGVEYDGEDPPQATDDDRLALAVFSMLRLGDNGIDWGGLELAFAVHGEPPDLDALIRRLVVLKNYRKPVDRDD